ncbi:hypothetical protein [Ottowia cancrivicina]|uniref:Uncharacterized protein n=1 Tax=Ottowia cancrivicina TaxID=3040346 RepID=A0AAW6RGX0_9BURK|nr:hypothetical protein [Ottowia sp. 10c7w1]MDG9699613.1 hypothetical protein [Ottowia sp. 10c7w1]
MIGMIAYAILGGFILIAVMISNRLVKIFGWSLSPNKLFLLRAGVFFGIFFVLFSRDIVGAIQFEYLCHRKINVKLEPNWQSVRRASVTEKRRKQYGYFIPTFCTDVEYYDMDTEKVFFSYTFCENDPSFIADAASLGNNTGGICFPKDTENISLMVGIKDLLQKGDSQ